MSVITSATPETVFVLRIALKHIKPEVWRRVVVPGDYTFKDLHDVIIAVMGWSDFHMHKFTMKHPVTDQEIEIGGVGDLGYGDYLWLPETTKIAHYLIHPSQKALHEYDFGSPWYHIITFEKTLPATLGVKYPMCIGGKRIPPPEEDPGSDYSDSERLEKEFDHKDVDLRKCRESIVEFPHKSKGVNGAPATNTSTNPDENSLEANNSKKISIPTTNQPPAKRRLILIEPQSSSVSVATQGPETDQSKIIYKPNSDVIILGDEKDSPKLQSPSLLSDKLNGSSFQNQQDPNILTEKLDAQSCDLYENATAMCEMGIEKGEDVEGCFGMYIASQMRLIPDLEAREDLRCEIQAVIKEFRFRK